MIPKILHYCWLSDDPIPELVQRCISSWKMELFDYQIILWDKKRFDINSVKWVSDAYNSKKYAFAADYIRMYALYNYGGIYLDSDVEVYKSFNKLLYSKSFMGFEHSGDLEPAIIGSEEKLEWVKKCLDYYDNRSFSSENPEDTIPLPIIVNRILFGHTTVTHLNKTIVSAIDDLDLYPYQYFSPKNRYTGKIESSTVTYAVHHFDGHWASKSNASLLKRKIHMYIRRFFGEKIHTTIISVIRRFS